MTRTMLYTTLMAGALATVASGMPGRDGGQLAIGSRPPAAEFKAFLADPAPTYGSFEDLAGKVVMVEFWTTWCAGCVGAIPHMNALVRELQGEPFELLVINNEEPRHVRDFLEDHALAAPVVLDGDNRITRDWGIGCYPVAILLDRQGVVRAITDPKNVTSAEIRRLVAGRSVSLEQLDLRTGRPVGDKLPAASLAGAVSPGPGVQIHLNPAREHPTLFPPDHGDLDGDAYSLRVLVAAAHDVDPWFQVDGRLPGDSGVYSLQIDGLEGERGRAVLREILPAMFGFRMRVEARPEDVLVLRALEGEAPGRAPSVSTESRGMATPSGFDLTGVSMTKVARLLSSMVLERLVLDETGLRGAYDLRASWVAGDLDSLRDGLARCGLTLEPARREVEMVLVAPVESAEIR